MNIRSNGKSDFDGQDLIPNLIQVQLDSFDWFKNQGIKEILDDVSPIEDSRFELKFINHNFFYSIKIFYSKLFQICDFFIFNTTWNNFFVQGKIVR